MSENTAPKYVHGLFLPANMISNAKIGNNVAIGVSATVTGGVEIADGKLVPPVR